MAVMRESDKISCTLDDGRELNARMSDIRRWRISNGLCPQCGGSITTVMTFKGVTPRVTGSWDKWSFDRSTPSTTTKSCDSCKWDQVRVDIATPLHAPSREELVKIAPSSAWKLPEAKVLAAESQQDVEQALKRINELSREIGTLREVVIRGENARQAGQSYGASRDSAINNASLRVMNGWVEPGNPSDTQHASGYLLASNTTGQASRISKVHASLIQERVARAIYPENQSWDNATSFERTTYHHRAQRAIQALASLGWIELVD